MKISIPLFLFGIYFPSLKYFLYGDPKALDHYYHYEHTKELLTPYTRMFNFIERLDNNAVKIQSSFTEPPSSNDFHYHCLLLKKLEGKEKHSLQFPGDGDEVCYEGQNTCLYQRKKR